MKKAFIISVIVHLLLFIIVGYASMQSQHRLDRQITSKPIVIEANLVFPTIQPVKTTDKPAEQNPVLAQQSIEITKPTTPEPQPPKTVTSLATQPTTEQPTKQITKQANKPTTQQTIKPNEPQTTQATASFNPYQSVQSMINDNNQSFFEQLDVKQQTQMTDKRQTRSINSQRSPLAQPEVKALYETAVQIDQNTRVINYHGQCVQIKRTTDFNGFSQFEWVGTSVDCGADNVMKQQLKLSLDKFLKPKSINQN